MDKPDGCVRFNRKSWHYKTANYVFPYTLEHYDGKPKGTNLCPYMRMVLFSTLAIPFMAMWNQLPDRVKDFAGYIQAELIFLALVIIVSFTLTVTDPLDDVIFFPPFSTLVFYGFIGGNVVGILGGGFLIGCVALGDYIKGRPKKEHRTAGLLKTYMNSKHEKICPCVEFVDDD